MDMMARTFSGGFSGGLSGGVWEASGREHERHGGTGVHVGTPH